MSAPLGTVNGNGLYGNPYDGGASGQQRILNNPLAVTGPQFTGGAVGAPGGVGGAVPTGGITSDKPGRGSNGLIPYGRVVAGDFLAPHGSNQTDSSRRLKNAQPGELVWIGRQGPNSYGGTAMASDRRMDTIATTDYVMDFFAGQHAFTDASDSKRYISNSDGSTGVARRRQDSRSVVANNWIYKLQEMGGVPMNERADERGDKEGDNYGHAGGIAYHVDDPRAWGVGLTDTAAPGRSISHSGNYKYNLTNMYSNPVSRRYLIEKKDLLSSPQEYDTGTLDEVPAYSGGGLVFSLQSSFVGETPLRNHECITNFDPLKAELKEGMRKLYGAHEPPKASSIGVFTHDVQRWIQTYIYSELKENEARNGQWIFHHPKYSYIRKFPDLTSLPVNVFLPSRQTGEAPLFFDTKRNLFPEDNMFLENALLDPHHPFFRLDAALNCFTDSNSLHSSVVDDYKQRFLTWARARVDYMFRAESSVLAALTKRISVDWKNNSFDNLKKAIESSSCAQLVDYGSFVSAATTIYLADGPAQRAGWGARTPEEKTRRLAAFLYEKDSADAGVRKDYLRAMRLTLSNADDDNKTKSKAKVRVALLAILRCSTASIGGAVRFVSKLISDCFVSDNDSMDSGDVPFAAFDVEDVVWKAFADAVVRFSGPELLGEGHRLVAGDQTRSAVPQARSFDTPIPTTGRAGDAKDSAKVKLHLKAHARTLICSPMQEDLLNLLGPGNDSLASQLVDSIVDATGTVNPNQWTALQTEYNERCKELTTELGVDDDDGYTMLSYLYAAPRAAPNIGPATAMKPFVEPAAANVPPFHVALGSVDSTVEKGHTLLITGMRYAFTLATRRIVGDRSGPHIGMWLKENPNAVVALRSSSEYTAIGAGARDDPIARGGVPTASNGELATRLLMYNLSKGPEVADEMLRMDEAASLLGPLSIWVPDGILLSIFGDTMVPSMSARDVSVINSRQGVVVNIGKQGVTTTHTWSGAHHLATLPRDTVYVVLVAKRSIVRYHTAMFCVGTENKEHPVGVYNKGIDGYVSDADDSTKGSKLTPQFNPFDPTHVVVKQPGDIKSESLIDFRWIRTTSNDMMKRGGPTGAYMGRNDAFDVMQGNLSGSSGTDHTLGADKDGAEWILGGWRIGSVLDSAAIRTNDPLSGTASTARPTSKQQIAVDPQWMTGPQLEERFSHGGESICEPMKMRDLGFKMKDGFVDVADGLGILGASFEEALSLSGLNGTAMGTELFAKQQWLTEARQKFNTYDESREGRVVDSTILAAEEIKLYMRFNGNKRLHNFMEYTPVVGFKRKNNLGADGDVMKAADNINAGSCASVSSAAASTSGLDTLLVGAGASASAQPANAAPPVSAPAKRQVSAPPSSDSNSLADLLGAGSSRTSGSSVRRSRRDE